MLVHVLLSWWLLLLLLTINYCLGLPNIFLLFGDLVFLLNYRLISFISGLVLQESLHLLYIFVIDVLLRI